MEAAASIGLLINIGKTEYMALNYPGNDKLSAGYKPLKQVNDFRYLSSMVASSFSDLICILESREDLALLLISTP